jgi:hypothetical protein
MRIALETAKCLALHHISTKNGKNKNKKHKLRSTICMHSAKHFAVSNAMRIDFLLLFCFILHVLSLLLLVYACS